MITEIFIIIPIVLMIGLFVILSDYTDPMIAIAIGLACAGVVTLGLGVLGKKIGIFRDEKEIKK